MLTLNIIFLIIVQRHTKNFIITKTTATAFLHLV